MDWNAYSLILNINLFTYIGPIYGFQRRCMYVKRTWMDTELLLSRKEIPYKFLCQGHHINLPPPLKCTGETHTVRCITNTLYSGICCDQFHKKYCFVKYFMSVLFHNNQIVSVWQPEKNKQSASKCNICNTVLQKPYSLYNEIAIIS